MQEAKGGLVSKQKVLEITKAAMNGVRYFKHVVFIIERYLAKCRQEFKVPALYVMDSILRQAKKQYKHKDVFAPRFSINLSNTVQNVLTCESADRLKVVRVVNLWQAHQIFTEETLEPVLQHCRASGLEVDPGRVEQLVKGDKADMLLYQPQFAERGLSFNSSGGSTGVGTTLKDLPIPIIPSEQTHRIVPPPPPGPPPPSTTTGAATQNVHHQPSLEERLSQFKKLSSCAALATMTPLATAAVPSLSRTNSVSGGTPTALGTSRSNETGPKTPPLEDQDHRFATVQLSQTTISAISSVEDQRPQDIGLSSMDVLQLLLTGVGALVPPDIGARPDVLTKVQRLLNERVGESLEIERRREGNIKNLLSREFDYSDEEDEAVVQHGQNPQHQQAMGPLAGVSREKMVTIAHALLGDGSFQQELRQQFAVQQQHAPFQLPDFSLPPPNIGAVINGGGGGGPPKMFLSPPKMMGTSVPLPPGTSPSGAFNMAAVPPPLSLMSLATNAPSSSSNRDQSPPSSSGKRQHHHHHRERDRGERDSRDRDRDGRRRSERGSDRPSASGRKRNREWSPSMADDKDLRRSFSPPGAKRERNEDGGAGGGGGRRNDRDKRSGGGGRRERGGGRHDEEERGERGKERDQQERDRRRIGLPSKPKAEHVLIASRTLWFGRIPSGASESDIVDSVKDIGAPEKVSLVFGRGCAYVTMPDRRLAFKIMDRLEKSIKVQNKNVKVNWATIPYVQENQLMINYWDMNQGFAQIPYTKLPPDGTVDLLMDGAWLELDTLPASLKDRYTNTGIKQQQQQQQTTTADNNN
uniref:CID domain-containing protein n=1 Tax=Globodera pallida TaxID=36090 RepID=A0A183CII6_GLOPA